MFWFLLAAHSAAPQSGLDFLLKGNYVPESLLEENKPYRVSFALTANPDGRVERCDIESSSGDARVDLYTCQLLRRRAKFSPEVLPDGRRSYLVYRSNVSWWVGGGYPPKSPAPVDLSLAVSALPAGIRSPYSLLVKFQVDAAGKVSDCRPQAPKSPVTLAKIACEQIANNFALGPARTAGGEPVASVQYATVRFESDPKGP